jgi:hypothetical protein
MNACFPGSLAAATVLSRTVEVLRSVDTAINSQSVLFGHSICPDEINNQRCGLPAQMMEHWGEVFPLGGLGGMPFAGKTGFTAFSHHVSELIL